MPEQEIINLPSDIDLDDLSSILNSSRIPLEDFGIKNAKTLEHLLKEIRSKETVLATDSAKRIVRILSVLCLDVLCEVERGEILILSEDRQVFRDGRIRWRNLGTSISEKLEWDEDPRAGIARSIKEELGINSIQAAYMIGSKIDESMSESFPGLMSRKKLIRGVVVIDPSDFDPQGYVEIQEDKINYFAWNRLGSNTNN